MSTSLKKKILRGDDCLEKMIEENYTNSEFNVDSMSRMLGISKAYLREIIGMQHGLSPQKLIEGFRLEKSLKLIEKDLTEYQIAKAVGYSSPRSYRRAFKLRFGILPSIYKKILNSTSCSVSKFRQELLEKL